MTIQNSMHIPGLSHDDSAKKATINLGVEPWLTMFAALPPLTPQNVEAYDAQMLLGLEAAAAGKDTDLSSPIGRGQTPFDGIEIVTVVRQNASQTASSIQSRKQIYLCLYGQAQNFSAITAIGADS